MTKTRAAIAVFAAGTLVLAAAVSARADLKSSNWSGYVAMGFGSTPATANPGMSFTMVSGRWVQPKAACTAGTPTSSSVWVGLGGYSISSKELEQAGTEADCALDGAPAYYAWYELVPASSVTLTRMKVVPGDVISASIAVDRTSVLVQLTDRTRNRRFSHRFQVASPDLSTAEWIVEAPARCGLTRTACDQSPLTNFGKVAFSQATAAGNGMRGTITGSNWATTALQLAPRATTSPLWNGGRSFAVTWNQS